ncbi:MAG: hypothetical protein ACFFAS_20985 [Promethearchaeota archaeon]
MNRIKKLKNKKFKPSIKEKSIKKPSKALSIFGLSLLVLGLILMPIGFVLAEVIQSEIDKGIAEEISIPTDKDSEKYDEWVSNDYKDAPEYYRTFYLWNLTNPDDFLNGSTPIYREIGPFVFREYTTKYDIDYDDKKEEMTYKQYSTFEQVEGADISIVKITNINPAYLGALEKAGGTDEGLIRLMFPMILSELREQFVEEYLLNIYEILDDWLVESGILLGFDPPGINLLPWDTLPQNIKDNLTPENFTTALPVEAILYEKWANDYFPKTGCKAYNNGADLDTVKVLGINPRYYSNLYVNYYGNANPQTPLLYDLNEGIDIDGRAPYNFSGSGADLNISTKILDQDEFYVDNIGGSGLTQEQCQALWDETDPNSLTGFKYEENTVWFDALEDDDDSRTFLKQRYGITNSQLNLIVKWMNVSCNTWAKNVAGWTLKDWNSWFITTRTAEEWLFTATDTSAYEYYQYYGEDINQANVGIFDNCHNELEADVAGVDKFTVRTGNHDISEVGQVVEYNGQDKIYIWKDAIEIEGTLGTQFAPGVTDDDTLDVFNVDLMRVVALEYEEDTKIYDIDLLQFKLAENTFSPNPVYFMDIQGLANLASVEKYQQVPVRVSRPHFLATAPSVQKGVIGMFPNGDIHDTYVNVEPITGIVMEAALRAQVNFEVTPTEFYVPNISNTIMPIVWFEFTGEITEDLAEEFKNLVYWALDLKEKVPLYCLGLGAALYIPGAAITTRQIYKKRKLKKAGLIKAKYDKAYIFLTEKLTELENQNKLYLEQLKAFQAEKGTHPDKRSKILDSDDASRLKSGEGSKFKSNK